MLTIINRSIADLVRTCAILSLNYGFLGSGVGSEGVAQKIIELSKKVRDLSAELERERSRSQQWQRKTKELEAVCTFFFDFV